MTDIFHLDCTLRDGGYYNRWNFDKGLVQAYLDAMYSLRVDFVELGFRRLSSKGFYGACAFTTDSFIQSLHIEPQQKIGVMVNASDLLSYSEGPLEAAKILFPKESAQTLSLVRIACHVHEFIESIPVCNWLSDQGFKVGINLMQIADRSPEEIEALAKSAGGGQIDVLYFADSMGSLDPGKIDNILSAIQSQWRGAVGIHAHDNMGQALPNTLRAIESGCTWVDSTVTGMGRGPGNAKTEYLAIELTKLGRQSSLSPTLALIKKYFQPMKEQYGWGSNAFYYLAGMHGIHPTFIQQMINDPRFEEAEILSVIEHLKDVGGKKYTVEALNKGRHTHNGYTDGSWKPSEVMSGREVLIIGSGPGALEHREAIEHFIASRRPYVLALNTESPINDRLIDARAACHPIRLMADCEKYSTLDTPLIAPVAGLPDDIRLELESVNCLNFGLKIETNNFQVFPAGAITPFPLVASYALAVAASGNASKIFLAGFDGYGSDDPRTVEMDLVFDRYRHCPDVPALEAITPTRYQIPESSAYATLP